MEKLTVSLRGGALVATGLVDKIKIFLDSIVGKKPVLFYWRSTNELCKKKKPQ
jgi:hypothetical protein